jgi:hypothetical protein
MERVGRGPGAAVAGSLLVVALLLTGCASTGDAPGAAGKPTKTGAAAPSALPSPTSSTGVVSPLPAPSYSPFGFEVCKPDRIEMPSWIPADLPLPEGIYATVSEAPTSGYERVFLVIPGNVSFTKLARMIVREWPKAGYQLGRGDSEASEIEAEFSKPPATGAFKVQATACHNPGFSVMYLIYAPDGPAPLTPSPTPS